MTLLSRRIFTRSGRAREGTPLRGELLSLESLEERAKTLAAGFTLARNSSGRRAQRPAAARRQRCASCARAYRLLADDVRRGELVDPAAEWLLDNFHLVAAADPRHPPRPAARATTASCRSSRRASSPALPRIYAMALELIRHSDGRLDAQRLHALHHRATSPSRR